MHKTGPQSCEGVLDSVEQIASLHAAVDDSSREPCVILPSSSAQARIPNPEARNRR